MISAQHYLVAVAAHGIVDWWFACGAGRPNTLCRQGAGCVVCQGWQRAERLTDDPLEFDHWTVVSVNGTERSYSLIFTDQLEMFGDWQDHDDAVAFVIKVDRCGENDSQWEFVGEPVYVSLTSPWMDTNYDHLECKLDPVIRAETITQTFPF